MRSGQSLSERSFEALGATESRWTATDTSQNLGRGTLEVAMANMADSKIHRVTDITSLDIYIYTYCYTHIFLCVYIYIRVCLYTLCIHMSTKYAYMHACMHTYMHTYLPTYLHTYIHVCMHIINQVQPCYPFDSRTRWLSL